MFILCGFPLLAAIFELKYLAWVFKIYESQYWFAYAMGIEKPKQSAEKNPELSSFIDKAFNGEKIDRLVMYNPDAIAEWLYRRIPTFSS